MSICLTLFGVSCSLLGCLEGMFRFRFGGKLWDMKRLPFGWKYLPVICQRLLGSLVRDLVPPDVLLIHYLDDFLLVARDRVRLRGVTGRVGARLREAKWGTIIQ